MGSRRRHALLALASVFFTAWLAACGPTVVTVHPADFAVEVVPLDAALPRPCGQCPPGRYQCDPTTKMCVECLANRDCDLGKVCRSGACVTGCAQDHGCGTSGTCDVDAGTCRTCYVDADCAMMAGKSYCDPISGHCAACSTAHDTCPEGKYCDENGGTPACKPGCKVDWECIAASDGGATIHCCAHQCVDTALSTTSCGTCGNACGAGATCCTGTCSNTDSDPRNCGACGTSCAGQFINPACKAGACVASGCQPGHADCDGKAANGCEVVTDSDPANCGMCGMVCRLPNVKTNLCVGGMCTVGTCAMPYKDCNGVAADGCEINFLVDNANCGDCNNDCSKSPHATASCMVGACAIQACDPGWADCNKMPNDGCESMDSQDPNNCGGCGQVCNPPPHMVATCVNSVCGHAGCVMGFADCNGNLADGCEVDLNNDAGNCSKCGTVCMGMGQNAVAACAMGKCTLACNAGFGDCDKNAANGCEANLNTDKNNCGACGMACPNAMPMCVAGKCTNLNCHTTGYGGCPNANQWCTPNPINANDGSQAAAACQACFGGNCNNTGGDCAGLGYCWGNICFGYQNGCSGAAGRVWPYGNSFNTIGFWAN